MTDRQYDSWLLGKISTPPVERTHYQSSNHSSDDNWWEAASLPDNHFITIRVPASNQAVCFEE